MKVLFVLPDLSGGGAEKVTLSNIKALRNEGIKADLYVFCKKGDHLKLLDPEWAFFFSYEDKLAKTYAFKVLKDLVNLSKNYDVIVGALEIKSFLFVALAKMFSRKKTLGWLHKDLGVYFDITPWYKTLPYRFLMKASISQFEKIVCVSKGVQKSLQSNLDIGSEKSITIYNPFSFDELYQKANSAPDNKLLALFDKKVFISVGRLTRQKNFPLLLDLHHQLLEKGLDHNLLILGEGEDRKQLENYAQTLGVAGSVYMPGFVNPYPYIKKSDLFILTSLYEGLPTVLIESMILGTPICSVDCPSGPREILDNGEDGLLLPQAQNIDVNEAVKSICELFEAEEALPAFRQKMAQHKNQFSDQTVTKQWQVLLKSVIHHDQN